MVKEEFYYDSRDGKSQIHAVRYTPEDSKVVAVLQIVHGMAEYVERYEEFAEFLTQRGIVVTAEDHLGHGKSLGWKEKTGYFCEQDPATVVVRDTHRLKKMTQALYPGVPYIIFGHSMGSFITRNYIIRYGTGVDAAVIMGTGHQPPFMLGMSKTLAAIEKLFRGSEHVSTFIDKCAFGTYNSKIENPRTPFDWLTRESDRVDKYIADPLCGFVFTVNGFSTLFELLSRLTVKENLERVPKNLPIFMVSGAADPVGAYGAGPKRVFEDLKNVGIKDIELKLYDDCRHELLNETNREEIMQDIYAWIQSRVLNKE